MKITIGIIGGKGKMGGFFKKVFEDQGLKVLISDRGTKLNNKDLATKSDVVIISVPIQNTVDVIKEIGPYVRKDALLMDFTSVKIEPIKAMLKYSKSSVLGCHPMFGPTNLINGQIIIFSPGRGAEWEKKMKNIFTNAGAIVRSIGAKEHDKIMSFIQGVNHFLSFAFPHTLAKSKIPFKKFMEFQTPVYRIVSDFFGRYLDQDPDLYSAIQLYNPENEKSVKMFLDSGSDFLKIIKKRDSNGFSEFFKKGKKYLGGFTKKAQKESDEIIDALAIKIASSYEKDFWKKQPKKANIAVLGPENAHSHLASEKIFKGKSKIFGRTISEVFELVNKGRADLGVVPLENKTEGQVSQTLDSLFEDDIKIIARFSLKISQSFITITKARKSDIKTIFSHPQALAQCKRFLKKNFPNAIQIPVASTSEAVNKLQKTQDYTAAAIASDVAAEKAGLKVMFKNIGDLKNNETFFAVISKNDDVSDLPQKKGVTSIAFVLLDKPGALFSVLKSFADAKVNLTKIQSRPSTKKIGEFVFFVDFENSKNSDKVLREIKKKTSQLKVLGGW